MQIIHRVAVMQVLTERSKEKLLASFAEKKQMLERECSQLYFQLRKHEKEQQNPNMIEQFKKAIEKRKDDIKIIDFQIAQVHTLPSTPGSSLTTLSAIIIAGSSPPVRTKSPIDISSVTKCSRMRSS